MFIRFRKRDEETPEDGNGTEIARSFIFNLYFFHLICFIPPPLDYLSPSLLSLSLPIPLIQFILFLPSTWYDPLSLQLFFLQSIFKNIKADLPLLGQTSTAEITKTKGLDALRTNIVKSCRWRRKIVKF